MFDVNPTFLVRVHPHRKKFDVSRNRTVLQVNSDGVIARGSEDGFFVKQHSWLGYYITAPPTQKASGGDEGSGQDQEPSQQTLELRVSRHVDEAVHEDLDLTNFTQRDVAFHFELEVESDFADQDELQSGERQQKGELRSDWYQNSAGEWELKFDYIVEHAFNHQVNKGIARLDRGLVMRVARSDSPPSYHSGRIKFEIQLGPHQHWHTCIHLIPRIETYQAEPIRHCPSFFGENSRFDHLSQSFLGAATKFRAPVSGTLTPAVVSLMERAKEDLAALRLYDLDQKSNAWIPAAGLPTYIALFGRDSLTAAWEAALLGPEMLNGTLAELALWQGTEVNDWRDEQPGRMLHEAQNNPLAVLNFKPQGRYYGGSKRASVSD